MYFYLILLSAMFCYLGMLGFKYTYVEPSIIDYLFRDGGAFLTIFFFIMWARSKYKSYKK